MGGRVVVSAEPIFAEVLAELAVRLERPIEREPTSRTTPRLALAGALGAMTVIVSTALLISWLPLLLAIAYALALLRLHVYNMIGLIVALWYAGALSQTVSSFVVTADKIPIAIVLAAGTIFAAVYAAMNVDIRGRAELNKTASVNCRLLLLKTTPQLITAANALAAVRAAVLPGIQAFPTATELHELTGRDDLIWHSGFRLLPQTAPVAVSILDSRVSGSPHSLVRTQEVKEVTGRLEDACSLIDRQFDEILDAGLYGKLDRILGHTARVCLNLTADAGFGVADAEALLVPDGTTTFTHLFGAEADWYYPLFQEMAKATDIRLRRRCRMLAGLVTTSCCGSGSWCGT